MTDAVWRSGIQPASNLQVEVRSSKLRGESVGVEGYKHLTPDGVHEPRSIPKQLRHPPTDKFSAIRLSSLHHYSIERTNAFNAPGVAGRSESLCIG